MTITLGELRSFAAEAASYSLSDAQGDRQVNRWINQALRGLRSAHPWRWYETFARIFLDPEESGTNLTVTQDSASFSLTGGELIDSKYLDGEWELDVASEADVRFTLAEKLTPTSGVLDHVWTGTSGSGLDYVWSRWGYPLPQEAQDVRRVEVASTRCELARI